MQIISGILFHFIGGVASGSFYTPYKKVKGWAWESFWIVGGIFSWLIVPFIAATLTIDGFWDIIANADVSTLSWSYTWGVLWGIGGLTFGLAVRYLGISLGQTVTLGLTSAFGSLLPPIYRDIVNADSGETFTGMLANMGGQIVLLGVLLCLIGIVVSGKAGVMKEKEQTPEEKQTSVKEFSTKKGWAVAIVSGVLSACFNYGIEAGKPMANVAVEAGNNPLFQNNVTYIVLLWGGLTTNFIWCMYLNKKHKTFGDYTNSKTPLSSNYIFSAMAGTIWFMQFFFYGMGESKMGNGASSWILHMAFIILISNLWGIILNEWKGVNRKTALTITSGIGLIILSVLLVGYGNSL